MRRIPDNAAAVSYAISGNIDKMKDLFSRGLASPHDVSDTRAYTPLRVSASGKKLESRYALTLVS
jgi:hypothetical protein